MLRGECEDAFLDIGVMGVSSDRSLPLVITGSFRLCAMSCTPSTVFSALLKSSDPTHEVKTSP